MSLDMPSNGIVVGVDGSPDADVAVQWAVDEAVMRRQPLTIVTVISPLISGWSGGWDSLPADLGPWQNEQADLIIKDAERTARESAGEATLELRAATPHGPLVPTLVDITKQVDMMVVGCRGAGAFSRALLGSVSTALVHHAHCPVAVLHGHAPRKGDRAPIVVGVDGSRASERATALAFEEASWRETELVAMHAWSDADWAERTPIPWSDIVGDAEETLAERLAGWQEKYPDVAIRRVVVRDHPARHLLDLAESAQLVVVGSRGRGGFAGMLLGSVSSAVVHEARTPVLVARHE